MWWDDDTIERTVTKEFVCGRLNSQEIDRLDRPLSTGDDLTDCTYWEWLDEKAKKIFLVLNDLGLARHIFDLVDGFLEDDDLPIAFSQVESLPLTPSKDERVGKKFYHRQFHYLLRRLEKGEHIDYEDDEVVPLEIGDKRHNVVSQSQHVDKVVLPNEPGMVFCRARIPLGPGHLSWGEFMSEINGTKDLQNEHLLSYWASYTQHGYGYILFSPAPEYSLKSLFTATPGCFKDLEKKGRRIAVMYWIYCLVDTVCFLHNLDRSHGNIRPSTVIFTSDNHVFLSRFTRFQTKVLRGVTDNTTFDKEAYDYAAPEKLFKPQSPSLTGHETSPTGVAQALTPNLSQQAADIFSLGCVILELLSFLLKKQGKPFATHRAAKNKSAGRGGGVPDSSFHKNLGQVESWMTQLARDASKKDDQVFKGVEPMLHVIKDMLAFYPLERPTAQEVLAKVEQVLVESCGISKPHSMVQNDSFDSGFGSLAPSSSAPASVRNSGDMSAEAKRKSGSQDGEKKRNSSRWSGGSGGSSIWSRNSSGKETEKDKTTRRDRNGSTGSQKKVSTANLLSSFDSWGRRALAY